MKQTNFDIAIEQTLKLVTKAVDRYFDEVVNPMIEQIKDPEKVIKKPFEQWTPYDFQILAQAYQGMPHILNNFLAERAYKELNSLEQEVGR